MLNPIKAGAQFLPSSVSVTTPVRDCILAAVTTAYDGDVQMIDSASVRVHQHVANSKKATRIAV